MFLTRLLARTLGEGPVLTPRRASRFEGSEAGFEERAEEALAPVVAKRGSAPPEVSPTVPQAEAPSAPTAEHGAPRRPQSRTPEEPSIAPREIHEVRTIEQRLAPSPPPAQPALVAERRSGPPSSEAPKPRRSRSRTSDAPERSAPTPAELRVEHHSIERRFETLVREQRVERTREIALPGQSLSTRAPSERGPSATPLQSAPRPPSPLKAPVPSRRFALAERAAPAPAPEAPPAVHVTIGRVEVRAVQGPGGKPAVTSPRQPRMNLDDYLARRERR